MNTISFEEMDGKTKGFLLATLLFRSAQSESCLNFLHEKDREPLFKKAQNLLELPRRKRVSFLIAELRSLLMTANPSSLLLTDPSWIVETLRKENRTMQLHSLAAIPKSLFSVVGQELGFARSELENASSLSMPLAKAIRRAIENQLAPMKIHRFEAACSEETLLILTRAELRAFISESSGKNSDDIGMRIIAALLRSKDSQFQLQVAQKLHYNEGQRLLAMIKKNEDLEMNEVEARRLFCDFLVDLAKSRKINVKFLSCFVG